MDRAEEFYKRAIAADPKHANTLGNYAIFLRNERKDMDRAEEFYKRAIAADPEHANNLGNYANFLCDERKDMDRAEEFYKRAIAADPEHANNLGNYANFLCDERKDMDRAEEFYKRAIAADSTYANGLGNYSKYLFCRRRDQEAELMLQRAWDAKPEETPLQIELHFYSYAHLWPHRPEALPALRKLLESGGRSEGWILDENVRVATEDGHPHPVFLATLARVISGSEPIEALDAFVAWKEAGADVN